MDAQKANPWYKDWFDSPYYHTLYKHRDTAEASAFIKNLITHLQLPAHAKVLDLACGKGRFSIELAKLGYHVTGVDLSSHNISIAKKHATESLRFVQGDMRTVLQENEFELVLNLFTSFGYFNSQEEDEKVLKAVYAQLVKGGYFVIDFINSIHALNNLKPHEQKEIDGITFNIYKEQVDRTIIKKVKFSSEGEKYEFEERVTAYTPEELRQMLLNNGFTLKKEFGCYQLSPFKEKESKRHIIICQKT